MYRYIYIYTCIEHKHNENKMEQNRTQLPAQRMSHKVRARKHAEKRDTNETRADAPVEKPKHRDLGKRLYRKCMHNMQARCIGGHQSVFFRLRAGYP